MDKREFIKTSAIGLAGLFYYPTFSRIQPDLFKDSFDDDNDEWMNIRKDYDLPEDFINLENGYYCIQPKPILDAYVKHINDVNKLGAKYMRTVQHENKKRVAAKLAKMAGCGEDELVITRNTTESLDLLISGYPWKEGDEAIMANQDYGAMLDMFKQVEKRYGVVNKFLDVPLNPKNDEEIVSLYEKAITLKTKLIMVCHMINITGQILPIKKICEMAHKHGVEVLVDGAHAFAHIDFSINDLGCDYYGCSLHKWLSAPLGVGFMYVNKKHISKIWPLFAEENKKQDEIARLNHTGTIPVHTDLTIENAIDYLSKIGIKNKEARLRHLQNYWVDKVRNNPKIMINTPNDKHRSCAIANVGIKGIKPSELADRLLNEFGVYTVAIDGKGVYGCRITPNIYTTTKELDVFVNALTKIAS
ncbi:MAG: aminotransferase class V-fold PLP-dependent enzyme [Bacteroidia bacterium]